MLRQSSPSSIIHHHSLPKYGLPVVVIFAVNLSFSEEAAGVGLKARGTNEASETIRVVLKTVNLNQLGMIQKQYFGYSNFLFYNQIT